MPPPTPPGPKPGELIRGLQELSDKLAAGYAVGRCGVIDWAIAEITRLHTRVAELEGKIERREKELVAVSGAFLQSNDEVKRLQARVVELEAREPKGLVRLTSADGADSEQEWHAFPSIEQMDAFAEQDHPRARVDDYLVSAWIWHCEEVTSEAT